MGLDLTLIPIDHDKPDWGYGNSLLELDRDSDLFHRIMEIPTTPVPARFTTFRSREKDSSGCYGDTQTTPYAESLTAVTMGELKKIGIPGPPGAYVDASPDKQRCALFWH